MFIIDFGLALRNLMEIKASARYMRFSDGWLRLREFSHLSTGGRLAWLLPLDWPWSSGSLKAITIRPTAST
jgi:hypothetical protein